MSLVGRLLLAFLALCLPSLAAAQTELISPETLSVTGDIRAVAVDGERSWLDGGYGKARFGSDGDLRVRPEAAEAAVIWQPRFTWSLGATVVAIAQQGQENPVDLSEAMLTFKPLMSGETQVTARAGLFWPPVSLEHGHADWRVEDTITPSAINSWIGEEVKVVAAEATVARPLGGGRIAATAALFGFNSTAGTLLAFRGWALHDEKATAFSQQTLPALDSFWVNAQAPRQRPVLQADGHIGWYAKLAWSPAHAVQLEYFHYDNRGDPDVILHTLAWAWRTRFDNIGAVAALGPVTLKAQAMQGRAQMGYKLAANITAVDTRFRSAFLLATVPAGRQSVSARVEAFGTRSNGSGFDPTHGEDGWALTGAVKRDIGSKISILGEILHIDSRREDRLAIGLAPRQRTNQLQLALRLHL